MEGRQLRGIKGEEAVKVFLRVGGIMEYTVIFHPAEEGGYWVEVPA